MKVFLLTQKQFTEGNFGDLESLSAKLIGVYSSAKNALAVKKTIKQPLFHAQFGTAREECEVTMFELDEQPSS